MQNTNNLTPKYVGRPFTKSKMPLHKELNLNFQVYQLSRDYIDENFIRKKRTKKYKEKQILNIFSVKRYTPISVKCKPKFSSINVNA